MIQSPHKFGTMPKNNEVSLIVATCNDFLLHIVQNEFKLGKGIFQSIRNICSIREGVLHYIGTLEEVARQNLFGGEFYEKYI